MDVENTRIALLRAYLFEVIDTLTTNNNYQINANMLPNDINNYSLDKIPQSSVVEKWVTGTEIHRDVYSFRSRNSYSQDTMLNLTNVGFFEEFEALIKTNNENDILPEIDGIESIECLNCASMVMADTNTAEFDIQIQITYKIGGL